MFLENLIASIALIVSSVAFDMRVGNQAKLLVPSRYGH